MAQLKRAEKDRRLKAMAKAYVDMKRGIYPWVDRVPPVDKEGNPKVVMAELLRVGDYSPAYAQGPQIFKSAEFQSALNQEIARRDTRVGQELSKSLPALEELRKLVQDELLVRFRTSPENIPTDLILKALPVIEKLVAEAKAQGGPEKKKKFDVQTLIVNLHGKVPEGNLSDVVNETAAVFNDKLAQLKSLRPPEVIEGKLADDVSGS
jgi:hypothetical protein